MESFGCVIGYVHPFYSIEDDAMIDIFCIALSRLLIRGNSDPFLFI